jgi:hypothetical protein
MIEPTARVLKINTSHFLNFELFLVLIFILFKKATLVNGSIWNFLKWNRCIIIGIRMANNRKSSSGFANCINQKYLIKYNSINELTKKEIIYQFNFVFLF